MDAAGVTANSHSYQSLLQSAADMRSIYHAKLYHHHMMDKLDDIPEFLFDCMLRVFCECGDILYAQKVFDELPDKRSVTSWDVIISAYAQQGDFRKTLMLFSLMQLPHRQVYFTLFKYLSNPFYLEVGKQIHSHVIRAGYSDTDSMATGISNMYAKCGWLEGAVLLIDRMDEMNVVAITGLMGGYVQSGKNGDVFRLFGTMVKAGVHLDEFVFSITLKACAQLEDMQMGQQIHGHILKLGLEQEVSVGTPLVVIHGHILIHRQSFPNLRRRLHLLFLFFEIASALLESTRRLSRLGV